MVGLFWMLKPPLPSDNRTRLMPDVGQSNVTSRANKALSLSAAHRLISNLAETTNSRAELAECRDVMSQLERMVEDA